jgi:hypothetical protein
LATVSSEIRIGAATRRDAKLPENVELLRLQLSCTESEQKLRQELGNYWVEAKTFIPIIEAERLCHCGNGLF